MYKYSLEQIIAVARSQSSFYRDLYKSVPDYGWKYSDLPIVPYDDFVSYLSTNQSDKIFTSVPRSGFVASSSSTTGSPKICTFSKKEWMAFATILGRKVYESGTLEDGDIIANLTMPGRMRTSYLAASYSHFFSPADCIDIPICGTEETEYIVEVCKSLKPNTMAGLSYTLLNVANYLAKHNIKLDIKKIFYGGELMYGAQMDFLKEVFPEARIVSYMYGSNETGLVGYSDRGCEYNEHRVCSDSCIVEIIDPETMQPITEVNRIGLIVVTNLTKMTLPAIRLPVGDKGEWLESEGVKDRKFALRGRVSEPNTIIDSVSLVSGVFRNIADSLSETVPIIRVQLQVTEVEKKQKLTLKICLNPNAEINQDVAKSEIYSKVFTAYPRLNELLIDGTLHSFDISFVDIEEIIPTTRSAKHRQILDLRK